MSLGLGGHFSKEKSEKGISSSRSFFRSPNTKTMLRPSSPRMAFTIFA
jgi:hypothetical protein